MKPKRARKLICFFTDVRIVESILEGAVAITVRIAERVLRIKSVNHFHYYLCRARRCAEGRLL